MADKPFYSSRDPEEALKSFLDAHDNLDDRMREKALKRFLRKNVPLISGKEVLDVGAGGGIWTRFWLDEGAKVTALDMHGPILLGNKTRNPEAEFIEGDATVAKLAKKFDIIFAKDLIEHIPDDIAFLQNMKDHLKEHGRLVLTTQNSLSMNYFAEGGYHFLGGNMGWLGYDPTHLRFYDFRRLNKKLKKAGLVPIKYWSSYHMPYRFWTELLFKRLIEWKAFHLVEVLNLNGCFPFNLTGWNVGVIARKGE